MKIIFTIIQQSYITTIPLYSHFPTHTNLCDVFQKTTKGNEHKQEWDTVEEIIIVQVNHRVQNDDSHRVDIGNGGSCHHQ